MPDGAARLGIWNLLQLPSPGTMLISTRTATTPQKVFGAFAEGELAMSARGELVSEEGWNRTR